MRTIGKMFSLNKFSLTLGVILFVILQWSIIESRVRSEHEGPSKALILDERAFIQKIEVTSIDEKLDLKIASRDSQIPSNSRPRVYLFVFPMFPQSGEWVRVTGVIIPRLKDVKVKLTYTSPSGQKIIRYASTSGGGRFADLFIQEA